jgi:hypothetical protein
MMLLDFAYILTNYATSCLRHDQWWFIRLGDYHWLSLLVAHPLNSIIQGITVASHYLLIAATLDRITALSKPMVYKVRDHKRRFGFIALGCVCLAQLYLLPNAIFNIRVVRVDNGTRWKQRAVLRAFKDSYPQLDWYYSTFALHFLLIYAALVSSTVVLLRILRQRTASKSALSIGDTAKEQEERRMKNVNRLLIAQMGLAIAGSLPRLVNELTLWLPRPWVYDYWGPLIGYLGNFCANLAPSLNVVVYAAFNRTFREHLVRLLRLRSAEPGSATASTTAGSQPTAQRKAWD